MVVPLGVDTQVGAVLASGHGRMVHRRPHFDRHGVARGNRQPGASDRH